MTASAGGRELSQRLSKIETAISRRKTIEFDYYTMQRDEESARKVDPYHLVFRAGQFYLIGYSHERDAVRVFRLSRIRGKVSYATKAEHDFPAPEDFDRRDYATRADWQMGEVGPTAQIFLRERIAWLVERDFGTYGEIRPARKADGAPGKGVIFETDYASTPPAHRLGAELAATTRRCSSRRSSRRGDRAPRAARARHTRASSRSPRRSRRPAAEQAVARSTRSNGRGESVIRPERFARLVTLAGLLIDGCAQRAPPARSPTSSTSSRSPTRSCARTSRCSTSSTSAAAPTSSTPRSSATRSRSTPTPTATASRGPRACCRSRRRRSSPRSTSSATTSRRPGLQSARAQDHRALGHDPSEEGLEIAPGGDDSEVVRTVNEAIRSHRVARAQLLQGERGPVHQARGRAVPARQRPRGLVRRLLGPQAATTSATSGSTGSRRRRSPRQVRAAPRARGDARRRALARSTARSTTPRSRASGSRPSARAGCARSAPSSRSSPTAP